jgi:hypothetical protein
MNIQLMHAIMIGTILEILGTHQMMMVIIGMELLLME